jgi:hypothetical protein
MLFMSADGLEFRYREARRLAFVEQPETMNAAISKFLLEI